MRIAARRERRQSCQRVEIGARPSRIEPLEIDGVVNRVHRHARAEPLACVGGHALGIRQHRVASMRLARQQPRRQTPRRRVIVQVPHELRVGGRTRAPEKMHLQTVAVDDVGLEIDEALLQASRVAEGRHRSRQESCAETEAGERSTRARPIRPAGRARRGRASPRHRRMRRLSRRAGRSTRQSSPAPSRDGPRESRRACRATQSPLPRARRSG